MACTSETGFFCVVTGQIECGQVEDVDHLAIHYSFNVGADWKFLHGVQTGVSQIAIRTPGGNSRFVWNYPIEATFHSTNVHGWPQLVVSAYGINWHGKDMIKGYGCSYLPTTPGRQTRTIRLYAPFSSSRFQQCCAWLTSNPPEFFEPTFLAQGKGREVVRVRSSGLVKITFNVATKSMADWGYRISHTQERADQTLTQAPDAPGPRRSGGSSRDDANLQSNSRAGRPPRSDNRPERSRGGLDAKRENEDRAKHDEVTPSKASEEPAKSNRPTRRPRGSRSRSGLSAAEQARKTLNELRG